MTAPEQAARLGTDPIVLDARFLADLAWRAAEKIFRTQIFYRVINENSRSFVRACGFTR